MLTTVTDVWHTLRPPEGDKHGPLAPLLLMLTVVTGLVDAYSYLVLGHVFVANMTGNVVFLAFALVGAQGFSLGASLLALGAFALGALAAGGSSSISGPGGGGCWRCPPLSDGAHHGGRGDCLDGDRRRGSAWRFALIALLAVGSGIQNGTARKLAVPDLTTTVLTLTITGTASESRLAGGANSRDRAARAVGHRHVPRGVGRCARRAPRPPRLAVAVRRRLVGAGGGHRRRPVPLEAGMGAGELRPPGTGQPAPVSGHPHGGPIHSGWFAELDGGIT